MRILTIIAFAFIAFVNQSNGQANVLNPADPDLLFTSTYKPPAPPYSMISKWGHTNRNMGWNTFSLGYKSYFYKGMAFRLKFPSTYQHNVVDNKKYPVFVFLHGLGEPGQIWDNEFHLVHGGQLHANAVNNGTFDGFLLYPQSQSGYLQSYGSIIVELLDSLAKHVKADVDRVTLSGLSSGGQANWDIMQSYPKAFAQGMPISAARYEFVPKFPQIITLPIWLSNGGKDLSPDSTTAKYVVDSFRNMGGLIKQSYFPAGGHGIWGNFWAQPGYFDALNSAHKANPLVYFQKNQFCPGVPPNAKLALQAGFNAYEWEKDGVVIPGATSAVYITQGFGTYRGRFRRTATSAWSVWSPVPVVVTEKQPTITPPIQIDGLFSKVLPSMDGRTTVPLVVPDTYESYEWRRISDNALVSTANTFNAPVGVYKVKVTERHGCTSAFGDNFTVIAANGTNLPEKAINLTAVATSSNSVQLNWNDNPAPVNNETGFEIFRSTTTGNGYVLVAINAADQLSYNDVGLDPATKYFYVIRAVNNTGAAGPSLEANATTKSDVIAPTAPSQLIVTGTTRSSVSLQWVASTDNVGVERYEIYINGVRSYTTQETAYTINGLTALETYSFYVRAKDATGNASPPSSQVSATAALNGLSYKFYTGTWTVMPDFNQLTPVKVGTVPNVTLTPRTQNDNFGFLFYGYINIPEAGTYTFETNSDDGSKLYIGEYSHTAVALVNNDGLHGGQYRAGTITLTAGIHPIAITYFEGTGGESMNVYWRNNASITARTLIPNSAFTDAIPPAGAIPAMPSNLNVTAVSYKQVNLNWSDNSNNETGFELLRSSQLAGPFSPIATVPAGTTTYSDSIGLDPATKYWYQIRSVNAFGSSKLVSTLLGIWSLNNDVLEGSGKGLTLTRTGTPPYVTDRAEGSHAVSLNGTSQYLDMPFSSSARFPSDAYTTRTVGVWIKPVATTITTTNNVILDFGGPDNGLALRFNSGTLEAGIARGNSRDVAAINNIATNPNWIGGGWNHVAMVYDAQTLLLFVNGSQVATASLNGNNTVGTSTSASRVGNTGTNAFNATTSNAGYAGLLDELAIVSEPLNADGVKALMRSSYPADTTMALPAVPNVPSNLTATTLSPSRIQLSWNDNSNNELSFEIERSVTNANSFRLLAEIPGTSGSQITLTDSSLFSNTNYYYRVRAVGIGGPTEYTTVAFARTSNNVPQIATIADFAMRHSSVKELAINATDLDAEALVLSVTTPLPSFATFATGANGTGSLTFTPSVSDQGTYPVSLQVADGNGGVHTMNFAVTVNSNYVPVISPANTILVAEGSSNTISLTANDQDGNGTLVYSLGTAPAFASITDNGNGSASLTVQPGFAAAGSHQVTVNVADGSGGSASLIVNVSVADVTPPTERIYMSMVYNSAQAPAPWNNIVSANTNGLKNDAGVTTTAGIEFIGTAWNAGNAGAVTGNNSGIYPDVVIRDYFWFGIFGAPETVNFNMKGLTAGKYNVTLFGSSSWTGVPNNGTTIYTINGVAKPLNVHQNSQNTVTFSNIEPNASGIITVNMTKAVGAPYGVLTSVVLEKPFDDATKPVKPVNFAAQALNNGFVRLTWNDVSYNENNYLIRRATSPAGPYTLLNPGASNANDVSYDDINVASNVTYYYTLEATNDYGSNGETTPVSVTTINKAPVLAATADVIMKGGTVTIKNITATDDGADIMHITVNGMPAFGALQSTGNGTGSITFTPDVNSLGVYKNIIVTVTDNNGAAVSDTFEVTVTDPNIRTVYINYGPEGGGNQPAPWNNFNGYPFANYSYTGLKDDAGMNTGFAFRYLNAWSGGVMLGMSSGSNSGVFPDNVIRSSIYTTNNGAQTLQFEGLNPAKRYNIGFLNSFNSGNPNVVTYTNGAQTVSVDGKYNSTVLANLNGLVPNASGIVQVVLTKAASATFLMLNAVIIQEYDPSTPIVRPDNLFAHTDLKTDRVTLTWSDKSSNETGFQIWRSQSLNGSYSLVHTTAANVTSYTNTGLTPNIGYYYKVRAINGGILSTYSNVAKVYVASRIVLLNLNVDVAQHAPSPWNSTDAPSTAGATFPNLTDNLIVNSGITMRIEKEFNGAGFAGVNGAGIFPANVMVSNYWTDAGQLSQVKFSNLDLRKTYRIGIFGSNANVVNATATYSIGNKSVDLNSYNNNSKVVYIENVLPDVNGEIFLDARTTSGSPYSFTGAFTIEYYDDVTPDGEQLRMTDDGEQMITRGTSQTETVVAPAATAAVVKQKEEVGDIKVYPNPFTNQIKVEVGSVASGSVSLMLYDINGKLVQRSAPMNVNAGKNVLTMNIPGAVLPTGSYIINVLIDNKLSKSVRLIRVN